MHAVWNSTENCTCGVTDHQKVKCDNKTKEVSLLDGYIMTYDERENKVEAGQTIYGWRTKRLLQKKNINLYFRVQSNRTELNDDACRQFNRDGSYLLYTSPSPRDATLSRMPSSA